jgi:hypothetical protein
MGRHQANEPGLIPAPKRKTQMISFDDMYGNKYLSAADLGNGTVRVKIGKVEPQDLRQQDGSTQKKYVLFFNGRDKAMVLNKTNAMTLATAFGKNPDHWLGQLIEIYSEMTGLGKPGLRIRPPKKPIQDDMSNEIPF